MEKSRQDFSVLQNIRKHKFGLSRRHSQVHFDNSHARIIPDLPCSSGRPTADRASKVDAGVGCYCAMQELALAFDAVSTTLAPTLSRSPANNVSYVEARAIKVGVHAGVCEHQLHKLR